MPELMQMSNESEEQSRDNHCILTSKDVIFQFYTYHLPSVDFIIHQILFIELNRCDLPICNYMGNIMGDKLKEAYIFRKEF